jgi:hypothetical protein
VSCGCGDRDNDRNPNEMWMRTLTHFVLNLARIGHRAERNKTSGEGGKMSTKRMILLAAGSVIAFLSGADPGNRLLAQQPARQQTLSEIYRNSGDTFSPSLPHPRWRKALSMRARG